MSKHSVTTTPHDRSMFYKKAVAFKERLDILGRSINGIIIQGASPEPFHNFFALHRDMVKLLNHEKPHTLVTKERSQKVLSDVYNALDKLPLTENISSTIFSCKVILTKTLKDLGIERLGAPSKDTSATSAQEIPPTEYFTERIMAQHRKSGYSPRSSQSHSQDDHPLFSSSSTTMPYSIGFMPQVTSQNYHSYQLSAARKSIQPPRDFSYTSLIRQQKTTHDTTLAFK